MALVLTALLATAQRVPEVTDRTEAAFNAGFNFLLLAAMTLVAANLAVLRGRRHGTEELYAATPADPASRTGAHLLALAWPLAASVALLLAGVVLSAVMAPDGFGPPHLGELAVGPLLVAGAGALGVFLARWAPYRLTVPLALIAIMFSELWLNSEALVVSSWRWLAFWFGVSSLPSSFLPPRPSWLHLAYLVGLVGLAGIGALVAHGRRRPVVVAGLVILALVAGSGWALTRPPSATEWAARNDLLANPERHQVCERLDGVQFCAYPHYRPLVAHWRRPVAGVAARLPGGVGLAGLEVRQWMAPIDVQYVTGGYRTGLQRVLPDLPPADAPTPDDGALHPPLTWNTGGEADLGLALGAAASAVGLPIVPSSAGMVCDSTGQGRAVVALWLAGQATPEAGEALVRLAATRMRPFGAAGRRLVVGDHVDQGTHRSGVAWGESELGAALALLDRPASEVEAAVAAEWSRMTAPATTTEEVVNHLKLVSPPALSSIAEGDENQPPPVEAHLGPPCPDRPAPSGI
ncbi:MAG TPA: hypothetical protein VNT56_08435 [Acidimicrobiales bacterium]|nr:hypothetical protein [Acidimicrobiales bacterium]